jgi:hypothetical protein
MSAMNDPKIQQLLMNNPMAQQIAGAMQSHIAEHLGLEYKKQMEQMMGMELPRTDDNGEQEKIPEMAEVRISQMAAQAAQQLLQKNTAEVQAQQAAQQAQDPLIQLQQQELQIKAQEVQIKQQKLQTDAAAKADQLQIERDRIAAQKEIAGMQVGAKVAKDKAELASKNQLDGLRIGSEIARNKAQMAAQTQQKPTKKGD